MAGRSDTPLSSTSLHNQPQSGKPQKVSNKMESGIPRVETPSGRTDQSATRAPLASKRPVKEHSFLTDVADVRAMEQGLVHLLEDFHSGKLQAFGGDCMFDRMDQIREQQEHLARLHFELDLQHNVLRLDSEDSRRAAGENLGKLIGQLQVLSSSIQTLKKSDGQSTKKPENE